jgi:hypothetical protein
MIQEVIIRATYCIIEDRRCQQVNDIQVSEFLEIFSQKAKQSRIITDSGKGYFGKISLFFQDGKLSYCERQETLK